jgi:hypothetical protein
VHMRRSVRIAVVVFSLALALVQVHLSRPRHMTRSKTRACFANQKTLLGAVEMYNLDKHTRRTHLDAAFLSDLCAGQYLQSLPEDPGQGPNSVANYRISPGGTGITCTAHGPIQ